MGGVGLKRGVGDLDPHATSPLKDEIKNYNIFKVLFEG